MTKDEKRFIRREWINYALQLNYRTGKYFPSIRSIISFVRSMEILP